MKKNCPKGDFNDNLEEKNSNFEMCETFLELLSFLTNRSSEL